MTFEVAGHTIPSQDALHGVFGADHGAYPKREALPDDYRNMRAPGCEIVSALFFSGGSLADHGRKLKDGVDSAEFHQTLRALLSSFAPKHEVKIGTCGLLVDTYTEPTA